MSPDRRFAGRVVRLALTSIVALGLMFALWAAGRPSSPMAGPALAAGWVLMPALLLLSLRWPALRSALVVPATLVAGALAVICMSPLPSPVARAGWWLIFGGVVFGGWLGAWFWFRLLPVPAALDDPFAPGRWALIVLHVGAIVLGLCLVVAALPA